MKNTKPEIHTPANSSTIAFDASYAEAPQEENFDTIFETKPLDEKQSNDLEEIIKENYVAGGRITENQTVKDLETLKVITSELYGISRQGILLMGERIVQARNILLMYKKGAIRQWLELTIGSARSGYNIISYYEFYKKLSKVELQKKFKKLPLKPAYALASRSLDLDKKIKILSNIEEFNQNKSLEFITQGSLTKEQKEKLKKTQAGKLIDLLLKTMDDVFRREESVKNFLKSKKNISDKKLLDKITQTEHLLARFKKTFI